jgi:hypothetical protein
MCGLSRLNASLAISFSFRNKLRLFSGFWSGSTMSP